MKKSVSILGLGFVGAPLAHSLKEASFQVFGSTRTPEKLKELSQDGTEVILLDSSLTPPPEFLAKDWVVLNIPPFPEQLNWFRSWSWSKQTKVIFVSSTSVYADTDGEVDESSAIADTLLVQEEKWIHENFPSSVILRAGGIIGDSRHPGKILSGRKDIKKGEHPVNLIHVVDLVGTIKEVILQNKEGVFNVVSDEHHTRREFYSEYCERMGLELPQFDGSDKSQGKLVSNEKLKSFYCLKHPTAFGKFL